MMPSGQLYGRVPMWTVVSSGAAACSSTWQLLSSLRPDTRGGFQRAAREEAGRGGGRGRQEQPSGRRPRQPGGGQPCARGWGSRAEGVHSGADSLSGPVLPAPVTVAFTPAQSSPCGRATSPAGEHQPPWALQVLWLPMPGDLQETVMFREQQGRRRP